MTFSLISNELDSKLRRAFSALKSNIAISNDFILHVKNAEVFISVTDFETEYKIKLDAVNVNKNIDVEIQLPSKIILDTMQLLPKEHLRFNINEDKMTLEILSNINKGKYKIQGDERSKKNKLILKDVKCEATIPSEKFLKGLEKTLFATLKKKDTFFEIYSGMNIEFNNRKISMTATTGYILSSFMFKDNNSVPQTSITLPQKTLNLIQKTLNCSPLKIQYNDEIASITFGDTIITCALITRPYIDYKKESELEKEHVVNIKIKEFQKGVSGIMPHTNKTNCISLQLSSKQIIINNLHEEHAKLSEAKVFCEGDIPTSTILVNAKLLLSVLNKIDSTTASMFFTDAKTPIVFKPLENYATESHIMLLLPVE
jgi:DNA polymerase III sliding clamp (beta) subunit (PCNA family)